jgi:pimeloyl-ACP methyl ester carboxylesterase
MILLAIAVALAAVVRWLRNDVGRATLFADQTYHHQALRALNHVPAGGADVSEVLEATRHVRAGDADAWFAAWTALGDRNRARAEATRDSHSRGLALLRAHTYYLRAEFFLAGDDPRRPPSYARNTAAFYAGLDALGVAYERLAIPYGDGDGDGDRDARLNAVFYPAPTAGPLIVFCGGIDSTLEELYFFLVAAARARGYAVLTFEGPGQGAVLRDHGLRFTHEWERPTAAVLDGFLARHPRPPAIVLVGLSMGGYLAARAAAFEPRIDGVVAYDVMFDQGAVVRRDAPRLAFALRRLGLERLVDLGARVRAAFSPGFAWRLATGRWTMGRDRPLDVVEAFAPYTLAGVADRIRGDVLVLAGTRDQFVPVAQVDQLTRALTRARSVTTRVYDRASGGSEHSQLGASTLWQADFFDWLAERFGPR